MNTDRPIQAEPIRSPRGAGAPVSSLATRRSRASFTLIELLVVVAIILILMGLTLKVMSMVNRKTATARTLVVLEQVKGALGAYYSTYGSYPAVSGVASVAPYKLPSNPPDNMRTSRGLTACIMSGYNFSDFKNYPQTMAYFNQDARRWDYYFDKIRDMIYIGSPTNRDTGAGGSQYTWTNASITILDGWGREIRYSPLSTNNQEGYLLWSLGSDGSNGTSDDVVTTFE